MKIFPGRGLAGLFVATSLAACSNPSLTTSSPPDASSNDVDAGSSDAGSSDAGSDVNATDPMWCGRGTDVSGAKAADGFCLKHYASIGEARALVLAPNGDLFVAGPSHDTAGGARGGPGAIVLLSDDDHDGVGEEHVFLTKLDAATSLADVHGLALGGGYLYFTTQASVWRIAYKDGQRAAEGAPEDLKLPAQFGTGGRWTHGLARSAGGQLLASRGAYASCGDMSTGGEVSSVGAAGALQPIAVGFRNPMYLRCHRTDEVCAAMELGEDLQTGATEKMLMLHPNTNYGFPCCYTKGAPSTKGPAMGTMCGDVTKEDASFALSDTPFGFDWEPGNWPAPYHNAVFVALHGSAYSTPSWQGAAVVYAATDPTTHAPVQDWQPFQTGFGPGGSVLDRPSDVVFSSEGRMFIADDESGNVYWVAPKTLAAPATN
jgi:glucose/arabinose dehydrogenase